VQAAVQAIARNPLNLFPLKRCAEKFTEVLPKRFEPERTERGVVPGSKSCVKNSLVCPICGRRWPSRPRFRRRSTGLAVELLLRLDDTLRRMEAGQHHRADFTRLSPLGD